MSEKHPIIAITGSSGAGTTSVTRTFQKIFRREQIKAGLIEGDSFHRFDRKEMRRALADAEKANKSHFSHFGPEANLFAELEATFREYAETGNGRHRKYLHDADEAAPYGQEPGTFTAWERFDNDTDLLFYEGLHGAVVTDQVDVARHVDLLVGVVPVINLEWIQKIHRDKASRGYSTEAVTDVILRRMPDYVNYICPQFNRTHVNFQRVPMVDTSNPFQAREIPTADEIGEQVEHEHRLAELRAAAERERGVGLAGGENGVELLDDGQERFAAVKVVGDVAGAAFDAGVVGEEIEVYEVRK